MRSCHDETHASEPAHAVGSCGGLTACSSVTSRDHRVQRTPIGMLSSVGAEGGHTNTVFESNVVVSVSSKEVTKAREQYADNSQVHDVSDACCNSVNGGLALLPTSVSTSAPSGSPYPKKTTQSRETLQCSSTVLPGVPATLVTTEKGRPTPHQPTHSRDKEGPCCDTAAQTPVKNSTPKMTYAAAVLHGRRLPNGRLLGGNGARSYPTNLHISLPTTPKVSPNLTCRSGAGEFAHGDLHRFVLSRAATGSQTYSSQLCLRGNRDHGGTLDISLSETVSSTQSSGDAQDTHRSAMMSRMLISQCAACAQRSPSDNFSAVQILPGLFLGAYSDTTDPDALQRRHISLVINVSAECPVTDTMRRNKHRIRFVQIPLKDHSDEPICLLFVAVTRLMHEQLHRRQIFLDRRKGWCVNCGTDQTERHSGEMERNCNVAYGHLLDKGTHNPGVTVPSPIPAASPPELLPDVGVKGNVLLAEDGAVGTTDLCSNGYMSRSVECNSTSSSPGRLMPLSALCREKSLVAGEGGYTHGVLTTSSSSGDVVAENSTETKHSGFLQLDPRDCGGVMINCRMGVSRSASFILAYLILYGSALAPLEDSVNLFTDIARRENELADLARRLSGLARTQCVSSAVTRDITPTTRSNTFTVSTQRGVGACGKTVSEKLAVDSPKGRDVSLPKAVDVFPLYSKRSLRDRVHDDWLSTQAMLSTPRAAVADICPSCYSLRQRLLGHRDERAGSENLQQILSFRALSTTQQKSPLLREPHSPQQDIVCSATLAAVSAAAECVGEQSDTTGMVVHPGMTYREAYNYVKSYKPDINPNLGFALALRELDGGPEFLLSDSSME